MAEAAQDHVNDSGLLGRVAFRDNDEPQLDRFGKSILALARSMYCSLKIPGWGVKMADELPETAGAATRNLLGAVGFIVILLGGELLLEKTGERPGLGLGLVIGGIPIFFAGVFWRWLQQRLAIGISAKLNKAAADPRWWIVLLFLFIGFSHAQLAYSASHWDASAGFGGWIWLALVSLAVLYVLATWRTIGIAGNAPPSALAVSQAPAIDGQTKLDLVYLLNFSVLQTTALMLDHLIQLSAAPEVTDAFKSGEDSDAAMESKKWYVGYVRGKLGDGTDRYIHFNLLMNETEGEAERTLEATPEDQRPSGDHLKLRKRAIADLQFKRTIQFLNRQKRTVEENLVGQRHGLIEHLTARQG